MNHLVDFLIGGSVIMGVKWVATSFSPEFSPIVAGMPIGILASFFLNKNSEQVKYYNGYIYFSIITTMTVIVANWLCNHTAISVNVISAVAFILWAIASFTFIWWRKNTNNSKSTLQ